MKKARRLFEPITGLQIWTFEKVTKDIPAETIETMLADFIDIPDPLAMSKQEAAYFIEKLLGGNKYSSPARAKTEDQIKGDTSGLAYYRQVYALRKNIRDLGWSMKRFKDWLAAHTGQTSIRNLNREQVKKIYIMSQRQLMQRN